MRGFGDLSTFRPIQTMRSRSSLCGTERWERKTLTRLHTPFSWGGSMTPLPCLNSGIGWLFLRPRTSSWMVWSSLRTSPCWCRFLGCPIYPRQCIRRSGHWILLMISWQFYSYFASRLWTRGRAGRREAPLVITPRNEQNWGDYFPHFMQSIWSASCFMPRINTKRSTGRSRLHHWTIRQGVLICRMGFCGTVIGHGNVLCYIWLWRVSLRPDAGVSDDRLVCHHPISQPFTTSGGLKIQVRLRNVLRKDPTISYVEYLTNLSTESWMCASGRYLEADLLRDPSELRM